MNLIGILRKRKKIKKIPLLCERGVTTVQYYKTEPVCNENKRVTCILMLMQSNMTTKKEKLDG